MNPHSSHSWPPLRVAREWVVRILYQIDVAQRDPEEAMQEALEAAGLKPNQQEFVRQRVRGVVQYQETEIDPLIQQFARGWEIERMAVIDRNILRLATYELLHHPEEPYPVVIDDAVEIAKKYSTAESGRFVNGILGAMVRHLYPEGKTP